MKSLLASTLFLVAFATTPLASAQDGMSGMAGTAEAGQTSRYAKQKVVYHINFYGVKHQTSALRNVQNHINAIGAENLDLKVVLHGNGVSLLLEPDGLEGTKMKEANATDEMQARISGLKDQGVAFNICAGSSQGLSAWP